MRDTNGNEFIALRKAEEETDLGIEVVETGLTKREYFAAMALQGFLAADVHNFVAVEQSVQVADALINQLNKGL